MSQATPPEGTAPEAQPLDPSAPLDAAAAQRPADATVEASAAAQLPADATVEAAAAPAGQAANTSAAPAETTGDTTGQTDQTAPADTTSDTPGLVANTVPNTDAVEPAGRAEADAQIQAGEGHTAQSDETLSPTDASAAPADETFAPADANTTPADETFAPADANTTPADETFAPADIDAEPATQAEPPAPTDSTSPTDSPTQADADAQANAAAQAAPDAQAEKDGDDDAQTEPVASGERSRPPRPTAVVRYGVMRSVGEFKHNSETPIPRGTKVVIRSERGVELGEVIAPICAECDLFHIKSDQLKQFIRDNGQDYPFRRDGRILRLANPQDVIDYRHLEQSAKEAAKYCRQIIRDQRLDMRLVAVEHLLGGERLVFYFAAEHRVDFRELVRMLASQYRTRIEMLQVGARDEARLVADYERCGQQCCCQSFLKDLRPVSMRMAKTQKATLDPSKISGRCGRLMCCLRYEDATYEQLRKQLPHKNTYVRTAAGVVGRVVDTQIITQLVRIQLADFTFQAVATEDIVERNIDAPPQSEAPAPLRPRRPEKPIMRKRERLGAAVEAEAEARREHAAGDLPEDLAAVGASDDAFDDDADSQGADLGDAPAVDNADQTRQPSGASAQGGTRPGPSGEGSGKKRRRRRRGKGPRDGAAQTPGTVQAGDGTRNRGQQSGQGGGQRQGGDGQRQGGEGGGEAPAGPADGPAGQARQGDSGSQGGDRQSRRRRRRRGSRGSGNQNRPAGPPPPPAT